MVDRPFWRARIERAWSQAPIAWLTGPRRVGKTVLAKQFQGSTFLNCDLPSVADRLADPETFFRSVRTPLVVFDEVHQLPDPSRLLKIGADEFPHVKVIATGSSTLAATRKFRDSLAGRIAGRFAAVIVRPAALRLYVLSGPRMQPGRRDRPFGR